MKLPTRTLIVMDNEAIGKMMRAERVSAGKTLTNVAEIMGFSVAHASDLELGRRAWTDARAKQYLAAIKK